jgi:hypothetical protein
MREGFASLVDLVHGAIWLGLACGDLLRALLAQDWVAGDHDVKVAIARGAVEEVLA